MLAHRTPCIVTCRHLRREDGVLMRYGQDIARGLVNYSSTEARRIVRHPNHEIVKILGYVGELELIHRDNLALL